MKPLKDLEETSLKQLIDCHVVDQNNHRIGTLRCLWADLDTGEAKFLGVQTSWAYRRRHLVPAEDATLDKVGGAVRLPYIGAFIKHGPTVSMNAEIDGRDEDGVHRYYSVEGMAGTGAGGVGGADMRALPAAVAADTSAGRGSGRASRWRRITSSGEEGGGATPGGDVCKTHPVADRPTMDAAGGMGAGAAVQAFPLDPTNLGPREPGDANLDPSSDELDSRQVATQVGAVGMSLAGAAIGGGIAGPLGVPAGAVIGAIVGGLAGKEVAKTILPTDEDASRRANLRKAPYFQEGYDFADYEPAFKVGYEGFRKSTISGLGFDEMEAELRRDFEQTKGASRLDWDAAKAAVRDAWDSVQAKAAANKLE